METVTSERRSRSIGGQVDVEALRRYAHDLASSNGFDAISAAEVTLIVSELAANVLVHSLGGEVTVSLLPDLPATIRIEAVDRGPGIDDLHRAFEPGYSTAAGLGEGLALVQRLADQVEIVTAPSGTRITATRRAR